jgi:hypothetical protein
MERFSARMVVEALATKLPSASRVHVLVHHGRGIGGEFADDLLEDVLERHQSLDVAVFVDHEGHAALVALKIQQLRVERGARGTK